MLEYFQISYHYRNEGLGTVTTNASKLEVVIRKAIEEYITNQHLTELDIKIKKLEILLDKPEHQEIEMEVY